MRLLGGSFHPLCTNLLFFCWSWAQKDRDFLLLFPPRCCQLTSMESVRTFDVPKRAMRSKTRKSDRSITTTMAQVLMSGEKGKGKKEKCQKIQIFQLGQKFDFFWLPYCRSLMAVHHQLSLMFSLAWHMYSSTAYFLYHISRSPLPIVMPRNTIPPM